MLIGPSHNLLQALGSSVAPPESARLAPTPRAASTTLTPRPAPPAHAPTETAAAPATDAAPREGETAPRHAGTRRGSRLDIVA